jgi:hypothetical protein
MRKDFPNITWRGLANMHSKWRRGELPRLHAHPDDGPIDF